jgi:hypothetical protein
MAEPVPPLVTLWALAFRAASLERAARRLKERLRNERPRSANEMASSVNGSTPSMNTKAGAPTPAGKGDLGK